MYFLYYSTLISFPLTAALVASRVFGRQQFFDSRRLDERSPQTAGVMPRNGSFVVFDPPIPPTGSGGVCGGSSNGCWGKFDINTDAETTFPNTGRVVEYTLEITNTTCAPDGFEKRCLLINNQLPGPTIFMSLCNAPLYQGMSNFASDWGDVARITVINSMQDNGTSIHWHGIEQRGTLTQDGVNGVTECPLAPGKQRVYTWQATQHGTYWYHSHHSSQYGDGIWGAIVVNGPHSAAYDVDLGPITVSEIFHNTGAQEQDAIITAVGGKFSIPDNVIFNGTNINVLGGGRHFQVNVQRGQRNMMRFINTGVDNFYQVGIDEHLLEVIAIDGQAVKPYNTTWVNLGVGQRIEVIVAANAPEKSYWIRAVPQSCVMNLNSGTGALANAILSYTSIAPDMPGILPTSTMAPIIDGCFDEALDRAQPIPPKPVDRAAFNITHVPLSSPFRVTSTAEGRVFRWVLGSATAVVNWESPMLSRIAFGATNFSASDNVIEIDGSSRFAFWYVQNNFNEPHPLHMHGNFLRILTSGNGSWDQDVSKLSFDNPMRRDTFMIPSGGHVVMAFETSNPGTWIFHCHIAWHASEGLVTNAVIRKKDIVVPLQQLQTIQTQCKDWTQYFENNRKYEFVGSGL